MGTRSIVKFVEDGDVIVQIYQQYDGYPSGVGKELAKFLAPFTIVNGFGHGDDTGKTANGVGCLAAQFIAKFKTDVGGLYVISANVKNAGQDYEYTVDQNKNIECFSIGSSKKKLFSGTPEAFLKFAKED